MLLDYLNIFSIHFQVIYGLSGYVSLCVCVCVCMVTFGIAVCASKLSQPN